MSLQKVNQKLIKQVFSMFLKRQQDSHKGEHGRVMIVGGSSDYFGAPILCALGALYSGADLVYLVVPDCIAESVRAAAGPDFIVRGYKGEHFNEAGVGLAMGVAAKADVCVVGPGLGNSSVAINNCRKLITGLNIPIIVDADALHAVKTPTGFIKTKKPLVISPHQAEFEHIFGTQIPKDATSLKNVLMKAAKESGYFMLLKGRLDFIVSPSGHIFVNTTGNPGMTVGGTGDVLAGIAASFMAQHLDTLSSLNAAAFVSGLSGDLLYKNYGYFFSASQVAKSLPVVLKKMV